MEMGSSSCILKDHSLVKTPFFPTTPKKFKSHFFFFCFFILDGIPPPQNGDINPPITPSTLFDLARL